jgi:hypothetical protein
MKSKRGQSTKLNSDNGRNPQHAANAAKLPANVRAEAEARAEKSKRRRLQAELEQAGPGRAALIRAFVREAEKEMERERLNERWGHKAGAPETYEHIERVPSHRRQSPLARMARMGKISADELAAAHEIAAMVESIERAVNIGCASLEARVDYAGSAKDALIESLGRIRAEVAYRTWRKAIPQPKRMIIDMVLTNTPYTALAVQHGVTWRTARKRLITALRLWPSCKLEARHEVGKDEVLEAYQRLGEGVLLPPKPKNEPVKEEAA